MKTFLIYKDGVCPVCGEECRVVPLDDSMPYEKGSDQGIHYPADYGQPVSKCCEAPIKDAERDLDVFDSFV
jgi:hypothetical protein